MNDDPLSRVFARDRTRERYDKRHELLIDPERTSFSYAVVTAIAAAKNVDPMDLDPFLHRAIDPDALDALFRGETEQAEGTIWFDALDTTVVVESFGRVTVYAPTDDGGKRAPIPNAD